jgi:hypothetical protein
MHLLVLAGDHFHPHEAEPRCQGRRCDASEVTTKTAKHISKHGNPQDLVKWMPRCELIKHLLLLILVGGPSSKYLGDFL